MANTYLTRAETDPQSSQTTGTYSVWVKRSALGSYQTIFNHRYSGSYEFKFIFYNDDTMFITSNQNGVRLLLQTNRKFRDTNAWYHIVVAVDSTQGTSTDRAKLYINGVQETSFVSSGGNSAVYPSSSQGLGLDGGNGYTNYIGSRDGSSEIFDGSMSHFHHVDGTALAPTVFGSTDSTTGQWKINTSPSYTVGTKGFFILKDGNSVTDQSANTNNFTVGGGTLTNTEDSPSNVFATMATPTWYDGTIANGGNTVSTNQTNYRYQTSSIGVSKGRWYWEVKLSTAADYSLMGITDAPGPTNVGTDWILGSGAYDYSVVYNNAGGNGNKYNNAGTSPTNTPGAFMGGFAQGDIIMFALDLDSATKKLYIGTNDLWSNGSGSTNQTFSNSSGISITIPENTNGGFYFPAVGDYGGGTSVFDFNFGNGYFGTTAVSSAGTNASGIGIFEYDVPTGYTALSTKGLNL
nr:spry domain protein [uncultured Mediterranean phage uvMED]